jgi:isoleucyl-tRNA synthetase
VDKSLIDEQLSADMDALLRLVSLGSAARNSVKIKVRQPLAEIKVQPSNEAERRAIERFGDQVAEELNIKKVSIHANGQPLLRTEVKPNLKTLGPKFGNRLQDVTNAIETQSDAIAAALPDLAELRTSDGPVQLEVADLVIQHKAPAGWSGVVDRGTQVMVDARITEALAQEGMARDIVRQVNDLRKKANLNMEDRIELLLETDSEVLKKAIRAHKEYIANETLTNFWAIRMEDEFAEASVKIEGHLLRIRLRKIGDQLV